MNNPIPNTPAGGYYGVPTGAPTAYQQGYYGAPAAGAAPWENRFYQNAPYPTNGQLFNIHQGKEPIRGTNYLTAEELKSLEVKKSEVWNITQEQIARSKCTHKAPPGTEKAGQIDGYCKEGVDMWHCNVCNQDFHIIDKPVENVEAATNFLLDVMDTTKLLWLNPPKDVVDKFYTTMDFIAKIPSAYKIARNQWESATKYSQLYTASSPYMPNNYGPNTYGTGPVSTNYAPQATPAMMPYQSYANPYGVPYPAPYQQPQAPYQTPYGQPPAPYGQQTYQQQYGAPAGYNGNNPNPLVQQPYPAQASRLPGQAQAAAAPPPANPYGLPAETAVAAPPAQPAPVQQATQTPPVNEGVYRPTAGGTPDVTTMTRSTTAQTI